MRPRVACRRDPGLTESDRGRRPCAGRRVEPSARDPSRPDSVASGCSSRPTPRRDSTERRHRARVRRTARARPSRRTDRVGCGRSPLRSTDGRSAHRVARGGSPCRYRPGRRWQHARDHRRSRAPGGRPVPRRTHRTFTVARCPPEPRAPRGTGRRQPTRTQRAGLACRRGTGRLASRPRRNPQARQPAASPKTAGWSRIAAGRQYAAEVHADGRALGFEPRRRAVAAHTSRMPA